MDMPLWILSQGAEGPLSILDASVFEAFHHVRDELPVGSPIALVVSSDGGSAREAYQIGRMLQRRCGSFRAIIPRAAWSAATLLCLGAETIMLGQDAALGPLDAQMWDEDAESFGSVLNEVQALDQLRANALESIDATMRLLILGTGKKAGFLLPHVLNHVAEWTRPLLEKVDVVHYTDRARVLKVAEEYAIRLLRPKFPRTSDPRRDRAKSVAGRLVSGYNEHDFPIDIEEAREIGLPLDTPTQEQEALLGRLWYLLDGMTVMGRIEEVMPDVEEG